MVKSHTVAVARPAQVMAPGPSANTTSAVGTSASYSLTAPSGWLLRSQAEVLPQLQARVDRLQELLGSPESSKEGEALRQQTERLSKRLQRLEELGGDACQRLLASMSLLSSQIDVAVAEALQLEALEAEQEREEKHWDSKPVSPTSKALAHELDAAVETAETQVERLHEQLAALDGVATRVKEMEEQLCGGDAWRQRLEVFARSAKACELLKNTAQSRCHFFNASRSRSQLFLLPFVIMASSKTGAALTVAAAVSGACAFVAPSSSGVSTGRTTPALRGQVKAQEAPGYNSNAAAAVAVSTAAVLVSQLRKAGAKTSDPRMVALRAFEQELGVQPPVGYWDPAGLAKDGDVETFKRRRSVELKHGRIAMLATMGYITPEIAGKFPGYLSPSAGLKFADVPNGLAAISKVPAGGWTQILLYMGWCEVSRGPGSDIASGRPGDFGWYVLTSADPEQKKKKLSAELANGRLAMMAIIGMFYQDGLTGSAWGDWSLYTDSPLRADAAPDFSKERTTAMGHKSLWTDELGVTPPLGFWDPLGFSKYDNPALAKSQFQRRRIIEIQHGRVAMLACIGYIVPEYFRWPGYCSPSMNLAFTDIPNGLKGAAMVPLAGWLQIITFATWLVIGRMPREVICDFETGLESLG
eukprot:s1157_g7.t1